MDVPPLCSICNDDFEQNPKSLDFMDDLYHGSLPPDYEYKICSLQPKGPLGYAAEFRVADVHDADSAEKWLAQFEDSSKVTWRVRATKPESGRVNICKTYYRCQHNTEPRKESADKRPKSKNTKCPAQLSITVKRPQGKKSKAKVKDMHSQRYAMVVKLEHTHNHLIITADTLRHRDVSADTIKKFEGLFEKGHSPTSALKTHKLDLQLEFGAEYVTKAADRSQCPDLQFCYRLYNKIFKKAYGASSGAQMVADIEAAVSKYNSEQGEECAKMSEMKGKMVIAVCSPLMKRIHRHHPCSGELVFMDASGGMDRYNCRIFLLLTHSAAGGLPLGCIVTTSECREAVSLGLSLYNDIIPKDAYFGRGTRGPEVFMTDDSESERQSLKDVYPESALMLCIFHILQAGWRFLWEAKNAVKKEDRPHLLKLLKGLVYAATKEELEDKYAGLCSDNVVRKYQKFSDYCGKQYDRREKWALCYRADFPMRGNNTNNFVESAMRVLKDQIFERVRAYNPTQLFDFLVTRLPAYYERRLTDLSNGRIDLTVSKRFMPGGEAVVKEDVKQIGDGMFEVVSQKDREKVYEVRFEQDLAMCTCPVGFNGAPCKHQFTVMKHFGLHCMNFLPVYDRDMRRHLLFLATGSSAVSEHWFAPLPNETHKQFVALASVVQTGVVTSPQENDSEFAIMDIDENFAPVSSLDAQRQLQNIFHKRSGRPSSSSNMSNTVSDSAIRGLENGINEVAGDLIALLRKDPGQYSDPIRVFLRQFQEQKTDSSMISSLKTFGKYTGGATSMAGRKRRK